MGILHHNRTNDVLLLMPVRLGGEKLPRSKVRMLYSDTAGKVYTSIMERSVYELAQSGAEKMEHGHKPFATVGLEVSPGKFVPTAVEVGAREVWALEHILEHALKSGVVPDILKRYLKPIVKLGEANRETVLMEHRARRHRAHLETKPRVLDRLPYYPEHDIEVSLPIYKAELGYPLIVLRNLPPNAQTPVNVLRLLVLDSDGDMATIEAPFVLLDSAEKRLKERGLNQSQKVCLVISRQPEGLSMDYMVISQAQKRALDTMAKYFEETGRKKKPISLAANKVLAKARDSISLLANQTPR